jgi:hypothetical protein
MRRGALRCQAFDFDELVVRAKSICADFLPVAAQEIERTIGADQEVLRRPPCLELRANLFYKHGKSPQIGWLFTVFDTERRAALLVSL